MTKGKDTSDWAYFPTTMNFPTINIPDGEITQYKESTFSLNIPDSDIASVEWFADGESIETTIDKSAFTFMFMQPGIVNLSAKLLLKGCTNTATIKEINIEVQKAPEPYISGPSIVHEIDSFEIINLPSFATVSWYVKDFSLASISDDGVLIRNGNARGNLKIFAKVYISDTDILDIDKIVHIGFPDFSLNVVDSRLFTEEEIFLPEVCYQDPITGVTIYKMVSVMGDPYHKYSVEQITNNTTLYLFCRYKFIAEPLGFYDSKEIFEYQWAYSSLDDNGFEDEIIYYPSEIPMKRKNNLFQLDGVVYIGIGSIELKEPILPFGNSDKEQYPNEPPIDEEYMEVVVPGYIPEGFQFPKPGRYTIKLVVLNRGYNSEVYSATVNVFSTNSRQVDTSSIQISLFPNPATDMVTIQMEDKSTEQQKESTHNTNKTNSSNISDIQIWSALTMIKSYKTDQLTYQFSVSDLPKGMYFVRIIKDGKSYTQKLIKN